MLAALVTIALLQTDNFDLKVASPHLLRYPAVQRELNLTSQQITDVDRADKEYLAKAKRTHHVNSEEENAAVLHFLNAGQVKRLREISLQEGGPIVLLADFVAAKIGADHSKIEKVFEQTVEEAIQPMQKEIEQMTSNIMRGIDDPKEAEKKAREVDASAEKISAKYNDNTEKTIRQKAPNRILGVLTPAQLQAWKSLLGKAFPVKDLKKGSF